jgi:hypothetical protein
MQAVEGDCGSVCAPPRRDRLADPGRGADNDRDPALDAPAADAGQPCPNKRGKPRLG